MKINPVKIHPVKFYFLLNYLMFLLPQFVNSQEVIFKKVPLNDGYNIDFVTGIAQDVNGLMWFSTKVGLLSYDGNKLTKFKNNPINPNSLVTNFTESVYADNGKIWVGTLGKGLDMYEPNTGTFTHFQHDPNDPSSLSSDTVTEILRDREGILWIGTHGGLDQFNPETKQFNHFRFDKSDSSTISHNQVRVIYEDREGVLWIGTGSPYADNGGGPDAGGLNRMDKKTGTFTRFLHNPENNNSLVNNKIGAIYEDEKGVLWVGTAKNGLHRMNKENEIIERLIYEPSNPEKFSSPPISTEMPDFEHITFITQDSEGSYWFGTTESGVYNYNPRFGTNIHYGQGDNIQSGFTDEGAWNAYTSRDGMLWIGSIEGNIYRINPSQKEIPHYQTASAVNSFYEEPNGDLWIAKDQKITRNEIINGILKQSEIDITPDNNDDDFVQFIKEDSQENIWIGGSEGLMMWDKQNETLIHHKNNPSDRSSLSNNAVITIYEDSKKNLWVGTIDGVNLMDRTNGTFKKFYLNQVDTSFIGLNIVTSVLRDKHDNLWVGTWNGGGVYALDPETNTSKVYLSGSSIVCILEDSNNDVWLGCNYGFFRYDPETDTFVRYLDPFTLNGITYVFGAVEDNNNYLWVSSDDGLIRINPERNESNKLDKAYGLDKSNFKWNSVYKGRNGNLYFGDATGYYAFNPTEIITETESPEIVFTGFRLAGQPVQASESSPLRKNLVHAEEIRLDHNQNVFSFDYAIIDYVNPEENQLTYILENYDNHWLQPNSEQRAYYFNVPPGNYTFRVKGANSYGIWAEKKINITILPPWWKTWWAYVIYGFLIIGLIIVFDRIQRRRLIEKAKQQAKEKELEQAREIEEAYNELKITQKQLIHAEKMASLGELTAGIAHEIQNPLNFVNNFSEVNTELISELNEEIEKGDLEEVKAIAKDIAGNEKMITHHGKRADAIVKGMLQHSRISSKEKEPTDINLLADEYLRLSYHGLRAKDKSFNANFKINLDEHLPKVKIIPQDIGRVLLNLINNAFYTVAKKAKKGNESYKPEVVVSTKSKKDKIEIIISDNGNGIPDEVLKKIFQPFFTTKPTGEGTGLGLSMSYDIVTKGHDGDLTVETEEGKGSCFIINLPLQ